MVDVLTLLIDTLSIGAIYVLLGLAWVMVFRASGVLNFAVGQFLVLGVFVFYTFSLSWPVLPSFLITALILAIAGGITYLGLVKPVLGLPIYAPIMLTFGLSIVLDSVLGIFWGSAAVNLKAPFPVERYFLFEGVSVSNLEIVVIVAAGLFVAAIMLLLKYTRLGGQMRASSESALLASQRGVHVNVLIALAWALSFIAAMAGGIGFAYTSVASIGLIELGLRGLAPALLGGLDSVGGLVLGALVVALGETVGVLLFGGDAAQVTAYVILLLVLWLRPSGLFGRREAVRV